MPDEHGLGDHEATVTGSPAGESVDVQVESPIEPGSPSPENVAFVLLGVLIALLGVVRLVTLFG